MYKCKAERVFLLAAMSFCKDNVKRVLNFSFVTQSLDYTSTLERLNALIDILAYVESKNVAFLCVVREVGLHGYEYPISFGVGVLTYER